MSFKGEHHKVSRRREFLAAGVGALLAGFGLSLIPVVDNNALRSHSDQGFRVCFEAEALSPPEAQIMTSFDSVRGLAEKVAESSPTRRESLPWLLALILHESGGNTRAVSPIGFGGLLAFATPIEPFPHCCVRDDKDGYLTEYDLCNSEEVFGYRCNFEGDPRFQVAASLDQGFSEFERILATVRTAEQEGKVVDRAGAIAVFWSAGASTVPSFPQTLSSPPKTLEQLELRGIHPYTKWSTQSLINKVVEVFDTTRWLNYLSTTVLKAPGSPEAFPGVSSAETLVCFDSRRETPEKAALNQIEYLNGLESLGVKLRLPKIRVKRLKYGKFYGSDAWINLSTKN